MTIIATQLKLKLLSGKIAYTAWAVEVGDKYYYQIGKTFVQIEKWEYDRVVKNPNLYYFSTALKLQNLIRMKNPNESALLSI
jgi:hypothetical protein